jgi:ElaB/YqjD/DUF883 family membrane-anchored ribosome-binding protein
MSNMSNSVRDAAKDVKDTAKEASRTATAGAQDIQSDLNALKNDVAKLTQQLSEVLASGGGAVWNRAKSNLQGVLTEAEAKGQEAVDAVKEVGDNVVDAIDESLRRRPYTTLALAVGIGFLFGATWRR